MVVPTKSRFKGKCLQSFPRRAQNCLVPTLCEQIYPLYRSHICWGNVGRGKFVKIAVELWRLLPVSYYSKPCRPKSAQNWAFFARFFRLELFQSRVRTLCCALRLARCFIAHPIVFHSKSSRKVAQDRPDSSDFRG